MEYIIHRVNLIDELKIIPKEYGCEIDIRTDGSKLILNHDPFKKGDSLIDYLDEYKNGTLVLNIKESGIEDVVLEEVRKRNISSYFLLDVEFPYLFSASERGERNISVRFSEKEPIQNVSVLKNKVDWVWVDTITKNPLSKEIIKILKNFNICLVCPSRWNRSDDIKPFISDLKKYNIYDNCSIMTSIKSINEYYKL